MVAVKNIICHAICSVAFAAMACRLPTQRLLAPLGVAVPPLRRSLSTIYQVDRARLDRAAALTQSMCTQEWRTRPSGSHPPAYGDVVSTLRQWGEYQKLGVPPNISVFSSVVTAYSVARCDRVAVELFRDLSTKHSLKTFMYAYENLIVSAIRLEDVVLVLDILTRVSGAGWRTRAGVVLAA